MTFRNRIVSLQYNTINKLEFYTLTTANGAFVWAKSSLKLYIHYISLLLSHFSFFLIYLEERYTFLLLNINFSGIIYLLYGKEADAIYF